MSSHTPPAPNVSLPSIHEMFPEHLMRRVHDEKRSRGHRTSPSSNSRPTVTGCDCSSASTSWSSLSSGSSTVVPEPPHTRAACAYPQPHPHANTHAGGRRAGSGWRSEHPHPHARSSPRLQHPPPTHTHRHTQRSGLLGLSAPSPSLNPLERESRSRPSAHSDKAVYSFDALRSDPKNASSQHVAASAAHARVHVPPPPQSGPYLTPDMPPSPWTNSNPDHPQDPQNRQPSCGHEYPRPEQERRHSYASAPLPPPPAYPHPHPDHRRPHHHPHHPNHQHRNHQHEHQHQMETSDAGPEEGASDRKLDLASMNLDMHQPRPQSPPYLHLGPSHQGRPALGMSVMGGVGVGIAVGIVGVKIEGVEGVGIGGALVGKLHVCPTCFKQFNRPSSLRIHINTHTGATPFRCPWPNCGREFNVNSNMRRHHRHHTGPSASLNPSSTTNSSSNPSSLANGPDRPQGNNDRQSRGLYVEGQMELEDGRRKRRRTEGHLGAWEEERTACATLNPNQFQRGYIASRLKGKNQGQGVVSDAEEEEFDEPGESDSEKDQDREGRGGEKKRGRAEMDVDVDAKRGPPPGYVERPEHTDIVRLKPKARSHPAPNPPRRDSQQDYPSYQSNPSSSCALSNLGAPYTGQHTHRPVQSPASLPAASHASQPQSQTSHSQPACHEPSSHSRSRQEHPPSALPSPSPSLSPALSAFGLPSTHSSASSPSSSSPVTSPSESDGSMHRGKTETMVAIAEEARTVTKPRYSLSTPYSRSMADTRVSTILRPAFAHTSGNGSGKR